MKEEKDTQKMHVHKLGHFLILMCKGMERDKIEDNRAVRQVVVQAESKEGRDCMVKDLVL